MSDIPEPIPEFPLNYKRQIINHRNAEDVERILEEFSNREGFEIDREPGLRRLRRPSERSNIQMVQQRGCEIFLGHLPKDLIEDEIYKFCSPCGEILEIRLMLPQPEILTRGGNNNGVFNRGYAFVLFNRREDARKAISELNQTEIRPGHRVGVKKSVDNCRLFVGGLPRDKTMEEFDAEIRKHPLCAQFMRRIIMYPSVADKMKNRGFAFVEFSSHRDAAIVRRQLMREKVTLWGREICVDWAQPEPEVDPEVMDQVRIVYVRNLHADTSEEKLKELFTTFATDGPLEKVKKMRDFAFVHFHSRNDAERSITALNGKNIDGCIVETVWAKPPSTRQRQPNQNGFRHQEQRNWQASPLYQFPIQNGSPEHFPTTQMTPMPINGLISGIPRNFMQQSPRHYRNAAGTRRRFASRPNGFIHTEAGETESLSPGHVFPNGVMEGYGPHYAMQESVNGYPQLFNPYLPVYYPHLQHANHPVHHYNPQFHNHHPNPINEMVSHIMPTFANMNIAQTMHNGQVPHGEPAQSPPQPHPDYNVFPPGTQGNVIGQQPNQMPH